MSLIRWSDVEILSALSERILQKFAVDKRVEVLGNHGGVAMITHFFEIYTKTSSFDATDILLVVDDDLHGQRIRKSMLFEGINENNLIIITPSIERWLISDLAKLEGRNWADWVNDIRRSGKLRLLANEVDIDDLIIKDPVFAKFVSILIDR